MSRRTPRVRARFAASVQVAGLPHTLVCHTRDISQDGCLLDTREVVAIGTALSLALMDSERGDVVQVEGVVTRCLESDEAGGPRGIGVKLASPPPEWAGLVDSYRSARTGETGPPPIRLAVLVVGDEAQRRGALALYVTSGWDVRFAGDRETAEEALKTSDLDVVIADLEADDPRATAVLDAARRLAPKARRVLRSGAGAEVRPGDGGLVDVAIGRDAGVDALVDALSGPVVDPDLAPPPHSSGTRPLSPNAAAALLGSVVARARAAGRAGVVVFDLDSTLLDNRPRQAQILREYGAAHRIPILERSTSEHWQGWDSRIAMRNAGLDEAAIAEHHDAFRAYWHERFFTSHYCVLDQPLAGAVAYLEAIDQTGTQVTYVTGRHEAMRAGTLDCFGRHGMVIPDERGRRVRLLMKPTLEEHDDAYKARTYAALRGLGEVIAAFDNEPTHINGYREAFPAADSVHLATDHSLRGIPVTAGIPSILDFTAFRR